MGRRPRECEGGTGRRTPATLKSQGGLVYVPSSPSWSCRYYTQSVTSLWPLAGPAHGSSDVTISGEFSPGYDGVPTSAKCLFKGLGPSTVVGLQPTTVQCPSIAAGWSDGQTSAHGEPNGTLSKIVSQLGVALNGAYVSDDSSDYVSIRNQCPPELGQVGNFQRFLQYACR